MSPRRQHARQTGTGLPRHAPPRARGSGRGRWWAVAATAALVLTGGNLAWASATEAPASTPPDTVTLVAEVGRTAEDGTVSLLAPGELDGARVTQVFPAEGADIDEGEVVLVVEEAHDQDVDGAPAAQVRVASPRAGTLDARAEVGDELTADDVIATVAPLVVTAAEPAPAPDAVLADPVVEASTSELTTTPTNEGGEDRGTAQSGDDTQPDEETQSGTDEAATDAATARSGTSAREITPFAVGDSTITVTKRTVAQPSGVNGSVGSNTDFTAGATFQLHTYTTVAAGPGAPVAEPWATCSITAEAPGAVCDHRPGHPAGGCELQQAVLGRRDNSCCGHLLEPRPQGRQLRGSGNGSPVPGVDAPAGCRLLRDAR